MKLKTDIRIITLILMVCVALNGHPFATLADASKPAAKALISHSLFEFSPVIAGTEVTHSFTIMNKGDGDLKIPGVYSG